MFGLPRQNRQEAMQDLAAAIDCGSAHLSWYQLTLEPNTLFHHQPPTLPNDSLIADIADEGLAALEAAGLRRYEISAFATDGRQCRHNLNYWRFGDYVGIGPGAHGKRTSVDGSILRRSKRRGPADYLAARAGGAVSNERLLARNDLVIEFMLNALRLVDGVPLDSFTSATGLPDAVIAAAWAEGIRRGLMCERPDRLQATPRGLRFLNDLLALFLAD
jgi:oxygen-independent coproporphyrinogen-3 oxidase